jgi:hypothetical protein
MSLAPGYYEWASGDRPRAAAEAAGQAAVRRPDAGTTSGGAQPGLRAALHPRSRPPTSPLDEAYVRARSESSSRARPPAAPCGSARWAWTPGRCTWTATSSADGRGDVLRRRLAGGHPARRGRSSPRYAPSSARSTRASETTRRHPSTGPLLGAGLTACGDQGSATSAGEVVVGHVLRRRDRRLRLRAAADGPHRPDRRGPTEKLTEEQVGDVRRAPDGGSFLPVSWAHDPFGEAGVPIGVIGAEPQEAR